MTVRPATAADRPAIVAMATAFLRASRYGQLFTVDPVRLAVVVETCLAQGVILVGDTRSGELAGMLAMAALEHPFGGDRFGEEIAWWVDPVYRRGTLGPRLIQAMHQWAADEALPFVKVAAPAPDPTTDTPGVKDPAVGAFYERLGYVPVETAYVKRIGA